MALVVVLGLVCASAASANTLSVTCSPGPSTGGCDQSGAWQTSPVTVTWHVDPVPLTTTGCASQTYTDVAATVSCAVTWAPSGTASISFPLNVETSSPSATATPDRPPDANGWYNHPVTVTLAGTAFSGIAACTPAQSYSGPATASTAFAGTCTDNAGKTASASFPFRYDATPPTLTVSSQPADDLAAVSWHAGAGPAPLAWVQVARQPGLTGAATSVLYTGVGGRYQDRRVRNGTTYTYTITAADQAGNVTAQTVTVKPGMRLLSPAAGTRLRHAADAALDGGHQGQLLQRPAVPGLEDPQRVADARQLPPGPPLALPRQAAPLGAGALSLVRLAGLRAAAQGPLRQGPGQRHLRHPVSLQPAHPSKLASQPVGLAAVPRPSGGAGDINSS